MALSEKEDTARPVATAGPTTTLILCTLTTMSVSYLNAAYLSFLAHEAQRIGVGLVLVGVSYGMHMLGSVASAFTLRPTVRQLAKEDADIYITSMSWLLAATAVMTLIAGTLGGYFSDQHQASSFLAMLLIFRFLFGMAAGTIDICAQTIALMCASEETTTRAVTVSELGRILGYTFWPAVGARAYELGGFFAPHAINGGLLLAVLCFRLLLVRHPYIDASQRVLPARTHEDTPISACRLLSIRSVAVVYAASVLAMTHMGYFEACLEDYLEGPPYHIRMTSFGLLNGGVFLASSGLVFMLTPCIERAKLPTQAWATLFLVLALGGALMGLPTLAGPSVSRGYPLFVSGLSCTLFAIIMLAMLMPKRIRALVNDELQDTRAHELSESIATLYIVCNTAGLGVGSLVGTWLSDEFDLEHAALVSSASALVTAPIIVLCLSPGWLPVGWCPCAKSRKVDAPTECSPLNPQKPQ
jgi:MFS family permease